MFQGQIFLSEDLFLSVHLYPVHPQSRRL